MGFNCALWTDHKNSADFLAQIEGLKKQLAEKEKTVVDKETAAQKEKEKAKQKDQVEKLSGAMIVSECGVSRN